MKFIKKSLILFVVVLLSQQPFANANEKHGFYFKINPLDYDFDRWSSKIQANIQNKSITEHPTIEAAVFFFPTDAIFVSYYRLSLMSGYAGSVNNYDYKVELEGSLNLPIAIIDAPRWFDDDKSKPEVSKKFDLFANLYYEKGYNMGIDHHPISFYLGGGIGLLSTPTLISDKIDAHLACQLKTGLIYHMTSWLEAYIGLKYLAALDNKIENKYRGISFNTSINGFKLDFGISFYLLRGSGRSKTSSQKHQGDAIQNS